MLIPVAVPLVPEAPPSALQLKMKPYLLAAVFMQAVVAVCRILVMDLWGGLSDGVTCVLGYFAYSEPLIMYTIWYGTVCAMNFFFDAVAMVARLITLKSHYIDQSKPLMHNLASFAILAASLTALFGACVSYTIWKDVRRRQVTAHEAAPLMGPYMGAEYFAAPPPPRFSTTTAPFTGEGHRLGGADDIEPQPARVNPGASSQSVPAVGRVAP